MRVIILTEGGRHFGMGHITRCLSIVQAFRNYKIIPELIIKGSAEAEEFLGNTKYRMFDWHKNRHKLFMMIRGAEIVIVDSYVADKTIYKAISLESKIPVFIDDLNRIHYPKGVIISPSAYGREIKYPKNVTFFNLLGPKYIVLRKEFCRDSNKFIKKQIKKIMITFGGKDLKKMTEKIVSFLNNKYPKIDKVVVTGGNFKEINKKNTQFSYLPQAMKIKEIMLKSDLAISAGGQTLYELARMGVPTIGICTAKNQELNLKSLKKIGFIEYIGRHDAKKILVNLTKAMEKLEWYRVRLDRSAIGKKIIDGKGSERIVKSLLRFYYSNN